jgi:cobalamin 5'-phosphate synthase/cobalamin synthase
MTLVSRILATVAYVTCFPLARNANFLNEESLSGLAKFLPVAGVIIGGSLAIVSLLLGLAQADKLLSAAILTVLWLLLTNGLHYDGLMDTADGIFSHQSRERMLEIMHDSRVGNFGALAGVCVFVLKFASLASLSHSSLGPVGGNLCHWRFSLCKGSWQRQGLA